MSQPGYYDHQTVTVTLPDNLAPGTYYIGGIADYNNHVGESNESNNTYDVVQITVTAPPQPDLSEYVAVNKTSASAGGSITIDDYDMNLGNAVSPGSTAQIYLSTDATITTSDTVLATVTTSGSLATVSQPGYYDHQTVTVNLPGNLAPGTYYIGGIADYNNNVGESNESNNTYDVVQITEGTSQSQVAGNIVPPAGNDTSTFAAGMGTKGGNPAAPQTFKFNSPATVAGHELASLFGPMAADAQYPQEVAAGDHHVVFTNPQGLSPAIVAAFQTVHGFIIH